MTRRTRNEIERTLLDGVKLAWQDGTNRRSIALDSSLARRLCAYLLTSGVRDAKGIPSTFLTGLVAAYNGTDDPAQIQAQTIPTTRVAGPWRLARIETQGFGGLNTWKGSSFAHDLREDSLLIDGPNGSGKSSFVAAIAWALTGDRPRDAIQVGSAHDRAAVFNPAGKAIGNWPPLACYPVDASSLSAQPDVRVKLTFRNPAGIEASAERSLSNGQVVAQFDPQLELPGTLIESGVLMPIRLSGIRFGAGEGLLLEAVQTLTGLDEIVVLGDFVSELCHKGREYLGYARAQGRDGVVANFDSAMQRATDALKPLSRTIQDFQPADTKDPKGSMATLGTELQESATRLLQVIRADLASTIDLTKIDDQRKVAVAIDRARRDVAEGLRGLPAFTIMSEIRESLTETRSTALTDAIGWARAQLQEAITLHEATLVDPRFRLKALAAAFHAEHSAGSIENCPLCEQSLQGNAVLAKELQRLQTAREAAQRTFRDNANAITKTLESSIPSGVLKWRDQIAKFTPKAHLVAGMTSRFITAEQYRDCLAGIAAAVEAELSNVPTDDLNAKPSGFIREDLDGSRAANEAIAMAEHIVEIAAWSRRNDEAWKQWWTNLAGSGQSPQSAVSLSAKLDRLDEAVKASAPYSAAAAELRVAWKLGRRVVEIDAEQQLRQAIADAISPLKELRNFAEVEVKNAIEGLSSRMSQLLEDIHRSGPTQSDSFSGLLSGCPAG